MALGGPLLGLGVASTTLATLHRLVGVVRPPPKAKQIFIFIFLYLALGGGQTTTKGHGMASATPNPQLGWSGHPHWVANHPLLLLLFLIWNNILLLFLVSETCVSFVALKFLRTNLSYELDIFRSILDQKGYGPKMILFPLFQPKREYTNAYTVMLSMIIRRRQVRWRKKWFCTREKESEDFFI
jgi:hypothetical protein